MTLPKITDRPGCRNRMLAVEGDICEVREMLLARRFASLFAPGGAFAGGGLDPVVVLVAAVSERSLVKSLTSEDILGGGVRCLRPGSEDFEEKVEVLELLRAESSDSGSTSESPVDVGFSKGFFGLLLRMRSSLS